MCYKSLVRPTVEYASCMCMQRPGARYVCNRHENGSSVDSKLGSLELKSLESRRRDARLHLLYKIHHEEVAVPINNRLITTARLTRNMYELSIPSIGIDYKNIFILSSDHQGMELSASGNRWSQNTWCLRSSNVRLTLIDSYIVHNFIENNADRSFKCQFLILIMRTQWQS